MYHTTSTTFPLTHLPRRSIFNTSIFITAVDDFFGLFLTYILLFFITLSCLYVLPFYESVDMSGLEIQGH